METLKLLVFTPFYDVIFDYDSDMAKYVAKQHELPLDALNNDSAVIRMLFRDAVADAIFTGINCN